MDQNDNLYAILECELFASAEEIRSAYHKAAKKYHPDVNKAPDAEEKFKKINEAYGILSDPYQKAVYDILLFKIFEYELSKRQKQSAAQSDTTYRYSYGNNRTSSKQSDTTYRYSDTNNQTNSTQSNTGSGYSSAGKTSQSSSSHTYDEHMKKQAVENERRERAQEPKSGGRSIGCRTVFAILFVIYIIFSLISSSNSSKSTSKPTLRATTAAYNSSRGKTDSDVAYISRFGKKISALTIYTGKRYTLGYLMPDGYSITYYNNGTIETEIIDDKLYVTALEVGNSNVAVMDSKGNAAAICWITVKQGAEKTATPKPKASSIHVYSMTITAGKTYTITSWIPAGGYTSTTSTGIFTIHKSAYGKGIIIEGLQKGEATFDIYDKTKTKIGECRVTVKPRSSDNFWAQPTKPAKPTQTPVSNPADVPYKKGGYTAAELKAMGFTETVKADGTRSYPGFYQAPNGNYFPVN